MNNPNLFHAFIGDRVCKHCEVQIVMDVRMAPGQMITCECGTFGVLTRFPCKEEECNCKGFLSIVWDQINYDAREKLPTFEKFPRKAFRKNK